MESIYLIVLSIFFISANTVSAECENGWRGYKDELCIKIFPSNFLTYDEAKEFCMSQSIANAEASLVIVKEQNLQDLLADYTVDIFDNIWLGGKYDDASDQFLWEDGDPLTYTNWLEGYPRNVTDSVTCIEMHPSDIKEVTHNRGQWANAVCQKRNMVMCQRELEWTLQHAISEIKRVRKQLVDTTEDFRRELDVVNSRVIPIGSIYVEYFNQPSPPTLWPSLTWDDISETYAGLFFRTEGSGSGSWGDTQSECAPHISRMEWTFQATTEYPRALNMTRGWSQYGLSGLWFRSSGDTKYAEGIRYYTEECDVRPRNQAIRIWKRIA